MQKASSMKRIDYKILLVISLSIFVLYFASNFKLKLDKFNNSYYKTTNLLNDIRYDWHTHQDILKESIIFLHFNNDKISNHFKNHKKLFNEIENNREMKQNFPKVYKSILELKTTQKIIKDETYYFMIQNAKIKNSISNLQKQLNHIDGYNQEYRMQFIEAIKIFIDAKNNFNEHQNLTQIQFDYFKNYDTDNIKYKLNFNHIKTLFYSMPNFKELYNSINQSKLTSQIDNIFITLNNEASIAKTKMKNQFLIIILIYCLFLIFIVFLIQKVKSDAKILLNLEKEKQNSLRRDFLTNLLNRNALIEDKKHIENCSILLLDITEFNQINSIIGYEGGDYILQKLALVLKDIVQNLNIQHTNIYKIGVDQFAIILQEQNHTKLQNISLDIIQQIENTHFEYDNLEIPVYIQIGISSSKPLLKGAETAILQTKKTFEKVTFFSDDFDDKANAIKNLSMLKKVKLAIKENRIRPFFQPIVDLKTKQPIKYEALVRLIDNNGKAIVPYFFLELSKKSKLYPEITKIVIEKSIEFIKKQNISVSINISYQDINDTSTVSFITKKLEENINIAHLITFELLESDEIQNYNEIFSFIDMIKRYKCKLAIDDFGSGYSNFTHLFNMKPDILKLDGSLIKDIHTNDKSKNIVEAMVLLAKKSNMQTVAEFIDNDKVDALVSKIGIDLGQGYYYSPPKDLL